MTLYNVESYPFDSRFDGYDDEGYPVYDRAVGARFLRGTYEQFFTDGIFGTPADCLEITKADGLSVYVAPGFGILQGTIGGNPTGDDMRLVLTESAPVGRTAYGVFLRSDLNDDVRCVQFRIEAGEPGGSPTPPDLCTDPGIREIRLGYVVVPSGATDLTDAIIVDERGTAACPYAAPFEEIDVSDVVRSVKEQAGTQYERFMAYLAQNKEYLDAAIDDTLAGQIIAMINALQSEVEADDVTDEQFLAYVAE